MQLPVYFCEADLREDGNPAFYMDDLGLTDQNKDALNVLRLLCESRGMPGVPIGLRLGRYECYSVEGKTHSHRGRFDLKDCYYGTYRGEEEIEIGVVSERARSTILAALRYWQSSMSSHPELRSSFAVLANNNASYIALDADEIDDLCEQIVMG